MAVEHIAAVHPPADPGYQPRQQLMVIALGRLGMREFDLASDADLVFVLPDEDHEEHVFWTRVAERIVDLITAYTGSGVMFTVDTRLAAQRERRRAGAIGSGLQGVFRQERRGLGRHRVHEVARRGGRYRTRHKVSERAAEGGLAALRPERPLQEGPAADAACAWRRNRVPIIR